MGREVGNTVPNSTITQVQNMTRSWSQVTLSVEIPHGTDIDFKAEPVECGLNTSYQID